MRENIAILFLLMITLGCGEQAPSLQEFPIIRTLPPDNDATGATFHAEALQKGANETTSFGFVWDTSEPTVENSHKIELGEKLNTGLFEKSVNYGLAKGVTYKVRAFTTYADKTVYGNSISFTSKGSEKDPWELLLTEVDLVGWSSMHGSSTSEKGYFLFQSSDFHAFDPAENKFSEAPNFPVRGNTGTRFTSVTIDDTQYFFNSIDQHLYKFANNSWTIQSQAPFSPGRWSGYYHGHATDNEIYILSSYLSYKYDLRTGQWSQKSRLPTNYGYSIGGASLGSKAYLVTTDKNIWEYETSTNSWVVKTQYPGSLKETIIAFSHNNKLYFGLSSNNYHVQTDWMDKDLWSYTPDSDTWELVASFPVSLEPSGLFYFSVANKLYIGQGFQRYDLWVCHLSEI
ncbi:MAG: hypothetical protein RIG68_00795 [Imperialibacter sp.]|uniref:hypothetical protein n=1 Tax=Imperialibacter sp. TaxID=2038411 RepID=UPI0032EB790B